MWPFDRKRRQERLIRAEALRMALERPGANYDPDLIVRDAFWFAAWIVAAEIPPIFPT